MRKALTILAATAALTACGGGDEPASTAATSASSSSAPATTSAAAAQDDTARGNCVLAGLTYSPIASGLKGDLDLAGVVQYAGDVDLDMGATTQAGKDAAVALAELAYEISLAKADVLTGSPLDRAGLQSAFTAAQDACAAVGATL